MSNKDKASGEKKKRGSGLILLLGLCVAVPAILYYTGYDGGLVERVREMFGF